MASSSGAAAAAKRGAADADGDASASLQECVRAGDHVMLYVSRMSMTPVVATPGARTQTRLGVVAHDDLVGARWGCALPVSQPQRRKKKKDRQQKRGRGGGRDADLRAKRRKTKEGDDDEGEKEELEGEEEEKKEQQEEEEEGEDAGAGPPTCIVLRVTPELWSTSLRHRTQILYAMDIAVAVQRLGVRSGSVVAESGTGSASMTTSLARTVAPLGHVHTFEFNAARVEAALADLARNKLTDVVTVRHRDVVGCGFPAIEGGVDAVFLDLPNPWQTLESVLRILVPNGAVCSFSPCVEQVQRTCEKLRQLGFRDIDTVEVLRRDLNVTDEAVTAVDWGYELDEEQKEAAARGLLRTRRMRGHRQGEVELTVRPYVAQKGHTGYLTFAVKKPTGVRLQVVSTKTQPNRD